MTRILSRADVCTCDLFQQAELFLAELGFHLEGIVREGEGRSVGGGTAIVGGDHHHSFSETTIFRPNLKITI